MEPGSGVSRAQQERNPHVLGPSVDIRQRLLGGGGNLDQAAVPEAAAERDGALAIGVAIAGRERRASLAKYSMRAVGDMPARLVSNWRPNCANTGAIAAGVPCTCA